MEPGEGQSGFRLDARGREDEEAVRRRRASQNAASTEDLPMPAGPRRSRAPPRPVAPSANASRPAKLVLASDQEVSTRTSCIARLSMRALTSVGPARAHGA